MFPSLLILIRPTRCVGTAKYRLATPQEEPVGPAGAGYVYTFATDASCDPRAPGCQVPGDSYAMDKWCDFRCYGNPAAPAEPAAPHRDIR